MNTVGRFYIFEVYNPIALNFSQHIKQNSQLALPVAFGQVGQICINLADNIMVGSLGEVALAAVSLANAVFYIIMVFGWGMASALSPLVAEVDARGDYKKGVTILHHGLVINFLLSVLMYFLIQVFLPALPYLGQDQEVVVQAAPFLNIITLSLIPWILFESLHNFAEGLSLTIPGMVITWIGVVFNIIFNYVLIYGEYGFPKLGVFGAGYATLITRMVMFIGLCLLLYRHVKVRKCYQKLEYIKFQKVYFRKILVIGTPTGLQMLFEVGAFAVASFIVGFSGAEQLAAHQITISIFSTTYMLGMGFAVAATVRIGNQRALKNYVELRRVGWSVILMSVIFMSLCGIGFILWRYGLPSLYLDDDKVVVIAAQLLVVAALFQLSDGIQAVALGALRGMHDVKIPMWISFFAYWIVAVPLGWFCSVTMEMGALGVWIGLGLGLTIAAILLLLRYNDQTRRLIKSEGSEVI
ncbi:MAG: MATE family efflux transporter [Flavobacteriales bacterium]